MTYEYICDACGNNFDITQSVHDKALTKCNKCKKKKLRRVFHVPHISIVNEPKTIGHLASRNRDRMSDDEKYSISPQTVEYEKTIEQKKAIRKSVKKLGNLTPAQTKKYIETGTT